MREGGRESPLNCTDGLPDCRCHHIRASRSFDHFDEALISIDLTHGAWLWLKGLVQARCHGWSKVRACV